MENKNPIVTIEMEDGRKIAVELDPDQAPNTVNSFVSLVQKSFYDGLTFHRIIPGFVIQGGDPNGNGTGGPGYSIKGEFKQNGHDNDILHVEGTISMARAQSYNSAGSQFFIMLGTHKHLDNLYAGFGKVIEGIDVVRDIAKVATDMMDKPLEPVRMKKVTVDTFGVDYPEPEKC